MSDRALDPDILAGIQAGTVRPALFMFADFPSGARRLWTGAGDVSWDSQTWTGVGGGLIGFETFSETTDTAARGLKATLNPMDATLVANIVAENFQGRAGKVWFGLIQDDGTLVVEPRPLWEGTMDSDDWEDAGDKATLTLLLEHRLTDLLRAKELRYTDQDQQLLHPGEGDTGLSHMEQIQDVSIPWGRTDK